MVGDGMNPGGRRRRDRRREHFDPTLEHASLSMPGGDSVAFPQNSDDTILLA